jgi:hypothetical protein
MLEPQAAIDTEVQEEVELVRSRETNSGLPKGITGKEIQGVP